MSCSSKYHRKIICVAIVNGKFILYGSPRLHYCGYSSSFCDFYTIRKWEKSIRCHYCTIQVEIELFSFYQNETNSYVLDFWVNKDLIRTKEASVVPNKIKLAKPSKPAKKKVQKSYLNNFFCSKSFEFIIFVLLFKAENTLNIV